MGSESRISGPRDASTPPNLPPPRLARRSHRLRLLRCPAPSLHQGRPLPQIECSRIAWLVSHLASTYRPTQAAAPSGSRRSRPLLVGLGSGFHRRFRRIYAVYSIGGHSYVFFSLFCSRRLSLYFRSLRFHPGSYHLARRYIPHPRARRRATHDNSFLSFTPAHR